MIVNTADLGEFKANHPENKFVFTNGCFDILHQGHVEYLNRAKALGDYLIVGINTDSSVKRLKGELRPIVGEIERSFIIDNLKAVDFVILFSEETPLELIRNIKPDILVKGADYNIETVVGAQEVLANGGQVKLIDFVEGKSTSSIIDNIKKRYLRSE